MLVQGSISGFLVEFVRCAGGIIDFSFATAAKKIHLWAYADNDPFPGMIAWMETLATGGRLEDFSWNPERLPVYFHYGQGTFYVYEWPDTIESFMLEIEISRIELLRVLYGAFRTFVESVAYDFREWEDHTIGDLLEVRIDNTIGLHDQLSRLDWSSLMECIASLGGWYAKYWAEYLATKNESLCWANLRYQYDTGTPETRKALLEDILADSAESSLGGSNLRQLRSLKVEDFISV